jgi:hypothetical protein
MSHYLSLRNCTVLVDPNRIHQWLNTELMMYPDPQLAINANPFILSYFPLPS